MVVGSLGHWGRGVIWVAGSQRSVVTGHWGHRVLWSLGSGVCWSLWFTRELWVWGHWGMMGSLGLLGLMGSLGLLWSQGLW